MASNADTTIVLGIQGAMDTQQIMNEYSKLAKSLEAKPIAIKVEGQSNLGTTLGEQGAFVESLTSLSQNIERVQVQYEKFKDQTTGEEFTIASRQVVTLKDEFGNLTTEVKKLNEGDLKQIASNIKEWEKIGTLTATQNVGKTAREYEAGFKKMGKAVNDAGDKAEKFLIKAENMAGKPVEAGKILATQLVELKNKYNDLMESGDRDAAKSVHGEMQVLSKELGNVDERLKRGAVGLQGWISTMGRALKQSIAYTLSLGLIRKAQDILNDSIQYAIDLNTEMTKILYLQVEGAKTSDEINTLAEAYNKLGQEMGVSTLEVAKGSVEWLRQGRTVEETTKLMNSSLMLAKLGNLSAADSTEYLTAVLNSYKMTAEEAASVVDKLVEVDNIAATSTAELATALKYSAASAAESGVELEKLVSYIAVVSETTRQNAESIGQGFKTIFARMQDIKAGQIDEDGLGLNNVESALARVDIKLRENETTFRDLDSVLEDVASNWDTLNDIEQANIAKSIAGVRQQNLFYVLMQNMSTALEFQTAQYNSLGVAQDRYGKYLDSVQGQQERFNALMEEFKSTVVSDEIVKGVLKIANAILEFINSIGGAKPAITGLISALTLLKGASIVEGIGKIGASISGLKALALKLIPALSGATTATTALGTAAGGATVAMTGLSAALPVIGIVLGVVAAGMAIYNKVQNEQKERLEESRQAVEDYTNAVNEMPGKLKAAEKAIEAINTLLEKQKTGGGLDTDDTEELVSLYRQLYDLAPDMEGWKFGPQGDPFLDASFSLEKVLELIKEIKLEKGVEAFDLSFKETLDGIDETRKKISETEALIAGLKDFDISDSSAHLGRGILDRLSIYLDEIKHSGLPGAEQLAQSMMESITNSLEGISEPTAKQIRDAINGAIAIAGDSIDKDKSGIRELERGFKQLLVGFVGDPSRYKDDVYNKVRDTITSIFGEDEFLRIWDEVVQEVLDWEKLGSESGAPTKEVGDVLANELEKLQKVSDAYTNFIDTINDKDAHPADTVNALQEFIDIVDELGLKLDPKDITNFMSALQSGDTSAVSDYFKVVINQLERQSELLGLDAQAFQILKDSALNALSGIAQGNTTVLAAINMSTGAYQAMVAQVSSALFSAAQSAGIVLHDVAGVALTTEQALAQAMLADVANFNSAIQQMAANGITTMNAFQTYAKQFANFFDLGGYMPAMPQFTLPSGGGGGGGAKQEDPRVKEIENEIDAIEKEIKQIDKAKKALQKKIEQYEKQKDALDDQMDGYADYIDARRESLELAREEEKFNDEAQKKAKSLARLKTEIALLALDDSEEARAQRLALEEEAAGLEEEIAEDSEDRKLDLQLQALDDLEQAFRDSIDAQKDAIDLLIDAIHDQDEALDNNKEKLQEEKEILSKTKEEINELASAMGGAGGAGTTMGQLIVGASNLAQQSIDDLSLKVDTAADKIKQYGIDVEGWSSDIILELGRQISKWESTGSSIRDIRTELQNAYYDAYNLGVAIINIPRLAQVPGPTPMDRHHGGLVEEHHDGEFAGNLQSNEVFAKLLKGEYVATENQMDRFMKSILPKIATYPQITKTNNLDSSMGDITFNMPITVSGSLDKSVLPELKDSVIREINMALERKGIRRNATNFSM